MTQTLTPSDTATLTHVTGWLDKSTADTLLLMSLALDWQQNDFSIYGQTIPLPRREAIYGDHPYRYVYSGGKVVLTAEPWLVGLKSLRAWVEDATGIYFPLVIGNRYDSGRDHIGWHDDNRPELGKFPPIVSISLGATRKFQTRCKPAYKGERTPIVSYELGHGDLVVMPAGFQETHLHRIAKQPSLGNATRINWTFRPWVGGVA